MSKKYITTALPYINAEPHIGYAWEITRADIWARYQRQQGNEVFFNTGTDEHGLKIYQRAQELGLDTQAYCDGQVEKFKNLKEVLNLSFDNFIRTTDDYHIKAAQKFWRQAKNNGFIYKKHYKIKYCVGCELAKTDSELVDGKCSLHPNREIEILEEENYFFKFSAFQQPLLDLYKNNPEFVVPVKRFNEIKKFIEMGPEDFSVSRLKSKMPWGIAVPDDAEHVMYVWFDALTNYVSAIGYPNNMAKFNDWWPAVQVAGKDNLRQQSAMWQAMLMSVNLPASRQIFINSFLTSGGQKMSKSLGNVITPNEMVTKFGVDGTRYILASWNSFGEDIDITRESLTEKYNAELANGLGNLVSRVFKLASDYSSTELHPANAGRTSGKVSRFGSEQVIGLAQTIKDSMEGLRFSEAIEKIKAKIDWANKHIDATKLWDLVKSDKEKAGKILGELLGVIVAVGEGLRSIMPETAEKILAGAGAEKIVKGKGLFPRVL